MKVQERKNVSKIIGTNKKILKWRRILIAIFLAHKNTVENIGFNWIIAHLLLVKYATVWKFKLIVKRKAYQKKNIPYQYCCYVGCTQKNMSML